MNNIFRGFETFANVEQITKGWSEDKKYCLTTIEGTKYLLRITPISRYETRKSLYTMLEQVAALNTPMCTPVEFGICDDGVYSLQSWIDGEDLEIALPLLSETEQYVLGLKSGEIIKKMHTISAPETQEEWALRFNRKTDIKIQKYHKCGLRFEGDEYVIAYIEENRHLLEKRPQCFQHGDYHVGNMMIENGELKIIDFDRYDFGDPWEEFNRIVWSAAASPYFATGQLRGYFDGEPPMEFFKLLAFYIASNTLSSIYWAVPFGKSDLDTMMKQAQDVLMWFDNMKTPVPTWYLKDFEPNVAVVKPQSWPNCDKAIYQYISKLVELFKGELKDKLIGVYLHGSLAMNSYFPPKSDMDILVVVDKSLEPDLAKKLNIVIARYSEKRPTVGNIECSVITLQTAQNVPDEIPYELHFSEMWYQRIIDNKVEYGAKQIDSDLPAHLMTVKKRGVCLYGKSIDEVFGDVKWQSFIAAVLDDFDWLVENENICESPFYCILNICRILQSLTENNQKSLSKYEGAIWGLKNLPSDYTTIIRTALEVYSSNTMIEENQRKTGGVSWDKTKLITFRDYAKREKERLMIEFGASSV